LSNSGLLEALSFLLTFVKDVISPFKVFLQPSWYFSLFLTPVTYENNKKPMAQIRSQQTPRREGNRGSNGPPATQTTLTLAVGFYGMDFVFLTEGSSLDCC
jgi:hypothetical protein